MRTCSQMRAFVHQDSRIPKPNPSLELQHVEIVALGRGKLQAVRASKAHLESLLEKWKNGERKEPQPKNITSVSAPWLC